MFAMFEAVVFAGAFAASLAVFWLTLAPAVPRILGLLRHGVDPVAPRRPMLVVTEARLRQRVRSAQGMQQRSSWRAAA